MILVKSTDDWGGQMESARFDRFARLLGATTSRRAGFGLAVALLTGAAVADPASAAATCRRGRQTCQRNAQCCSGTCQTGRGLSTRDRNRCTCEYFLELCNNACVDINTDVRHCGACGNRCGAGNHCVDRECRIVQQCYSFDGGICYVTPAGQEIRADGLYTVNYNLGTPVQTRCDRDADCAGFDEVCDRAGVRCRCVRAMDFADGYIPLDETGQSICVPMLDNGDGAMACPLEATCVFTAAANEQLVCRDSITYEGPCNGSGCTGVGGCDDPDVDCVCAIAWRNMLIPGTYGAYYDFNPYEQQAMEPTCISYVAPVGGECTPPV